MKIAILEYTNAELIVEDVADNDFDVDEYVNEEYGSNTYWMEVKKITVELEEDE